MSDPALGLTMLALIVVAIMMGFPTAFTLMGMGMLFGYLAFWNPAEPWFDNRIFDLMVQRTYGVMTNDVLLSVPLFVFMGYIIERAALVDKMFFSVQLAFRRVPASLAVTTLLVCAFWGIASGIVGAVVVLMGVIALRPMLAAGYDVRLASGVITAGGTLGILIPPSVMLIVYAAVAGESIVKLYAAAMFPGVFLTLLYLIYIIGWALINPKVAPRLPPEKYRMDVPAWMKRLERGPSKRVLGGLLTALVRPSILRGATLPDGRPVGYGAIAKNGLAAAVPLGLVVLLFVAAWWYVTIHNAPVVEAAGTALSIEAPPVDSGGLAEPPAEAEPSPPSGGLTEPPGAQKADGQAPEAMGVQLPPGAGEGAAGKVPEGFYLWFWSFAGAFALLMAIYYWRMDAEHIEILKLLEDAVVPLGLLTFIVLAVILFGISTATESAAIGVIGALFLAALAKYPRRTLWSGLIGALAGLALGMLRGDVKTLVVAASLGGLFVGTAVPWLWDLARAQLLKRNIQESVFLTAKTTAMVCWLFVGSALFSAVFALHGGQGLVERWVLSMDLSPLEFLIIAQVIIFLLGWPLEWTEIIVIFVPIFIPLLAHFNVDPILFGTMVAVNLQAAFLSPPVAMSAFYLKGVAPAHVTLNQIFAGMMPYMLIVIVCLIFMYIWPGMTLWLPNFLYGK
jgi:TRAP-type mannitol/chloroaromatic compound transport system permease large subunit